MTTFIVPSKRRLFWQTVTAMTAAGAAACSALGLKAPLDDSSIDTTSVDAAIDTTQRNANIDGGVTPTANDPTREPSALSSSGAGPSGAHDGGPTTTAPPTSTWRGSASDTDASEEKPPPVSAPSGSPETGASETSDGPDSSTASATSQPPVDPTSEPPPDPPCALSFTTPGSGVHVSPSGTDAAQCGSAEAPCRTITFAQGRATELAVNYVYIARGQYGEALGVTAPIALIGGWFDNAGAWTRACDARADDTVVNSPDTIGLRAELTGAAHVESLTIRTSPINNTPGDSRYGIFARGQSTVLRLEAVTVQVSSGAAGAGGVNGITLPAADCSAGNGADGTTAPTTPNTQTGHFDENGYVPGDAFDGANGNPGQGGSDGLAETYACTFCNSSCMGVAGGSKTAAGGAHGCGGGYGSGGSGGTGGGASVGVFAWAARVELGQSVRIIAGDGGDGGAGGSGGAGQPGTPGSRGDEVECNPGTVCGGACAHEVKGHAGSRGGAGSAGADGGAGAGGWSVALVGTDGAFSGADSASMLYGRAGVSLGSGPSGQSLALYTIP